MVKKILFDVKDLHLALPKYQNTPISAIIPSPAELLFIRRLQAQIPMRNILLKPKMVPCALVKELENRNAKQKMYYHRNSEDQCNLKQNDHVMVWKSQCVWEPAVVVKVDMARPRAYYVKLDSSGIVLKIIRNFLKCFFENNFKRNNDLFDEMLEQELQNLNNNQRNTVEQSAW